MVAANLVEITDLAVAKSVLKLVDVLEENDDVGDVWANFDVSDELMEQLQ